MSLDIYLKTPGIQHTVEVKIYIREDGANRELTRAEWDERYPGREPYTVEADEGETVYSDNITHNLGKMAVAAEIYEALWRPEEVDITHAHQLIETLTAGLNLLRSDPERFKAFNPPNGWGSYDGLVSFVAEYLRACQQHPDAEVSAWR